MVWAVNKGLCPWFIQAWSPLSEQRLFVEFPWGEGGQESSLGAEQRGVQQCQPWCHCTGSAAGGGTVREDPLTCRRVLARSPDSKLLRKHSFYFIGLLLLPGNILSAFQRLVSFGCSYLSSADLPYNSWIKGIVPSICISVSVCQPVLSGWIVTLSWCHYSCDLWPVAGWLSAKGDEISLQCHPSLCLGNSRIPQRGLSH